MVLWIDTSTQGALKTRETVKRWEDEVDNFIMTGKDNGTTLGFVELEVLEEIFEVLQLCFWSVVINKS